MKKYYLLLSTLVLLPLCSCGNETKSEEVKSEETKSEEASLSISEEEISVTEESSSEEDEYELDDNMISKTSFTIGVNDSYGLRYLIENEYSDSWFEVYSSDDSVAYSNENDVIIGLKEGSTTFTVVADEMTYDTITINVISQNELNKTFTFDQARLENKTMLVLGDSISDISVSAYEKKQYFWCEQLSDKFNMKLYDFAKSGATTGYVKSQIDKVPSAISIIGTHVVRTAEVQQAAKESDYAFLYFGNNDCTYQSALGNKGDVNDSNYSTYESFKGAYSYIIEKIRTYNPNIKIVCLSLSYSTWGPTDAYRSNYADVVRDIANENNAKYVYLFDLWNSSNVSTYSPDGIHPLTSGYELIVNRILES